MVEVDVYYADMCGLCHVAMDYLTENDIPFNKYKLEWDAEADNWVDTETSRRLFERCGEKVDFVPQFFINDRWISGWKELEPMINSGELDELLKSA